MLDTIRWKVLLVALAVVNRHHLEVITYLREENRAQRADRRAAPALHRSAAASTRTDGPLPRTAGVNGGRDARHPGHPPTLAPAADRTEVDHRTQRVGKPSVRQENRAITVRMAQESPTSGCRRMQGALKNLGIASSPDRRSPPSTASLKGLVRYRSGRCHGAPFSLRIGHDRRRRLFTTEVWTAHGLVTYYTLFIIELASRRVQIVGSTPHPDEAFVLQAARTVTDADDGCLRGSRVLICDRDTKWSEAFRQTLAAAGVRVIHTPVPRTELQRACGTSRAVNQGRSLPASLLGEAHLVALSSPYWHITGTQ